MPELDRQITTVAVGLDGTCMLMCEAGWREAMVGTVSLYDREGERQHTIYLGATYVGIADGAESNWKFLQKHTEEQILDFYHASGYLGAVAESLYPQQSAAQKEWLEQSCHRLKHEEGTADKLYDQMQKLIVETELDKTLKQDLQASITYYKNHRQQMLYAQYRQKHYPFGSGVTEAACKTLIKQRLCSSGMRWKEKGASVILSLRALSLTATRCEQFWSNFNQYGSPVAL